MRWNASLLLYLTRRSFVAAFDDGCFGIAKAAAYSALVAFFPLLATVATVLAQTRAQLVAGVMQDALAQIVPPGTEELVKLQFEVQGRGSTGLLIFATLLSIWSASRVVTSLIDGFHAAYRTPRNRSFLGNTGVSIALMALSAIPLLAASALILFGVEIERFVFRWMSVEPPFFWLWSLANQFARYLVAFGATVVVTMILYRFGPYRPQTWRGVFPGAVEATLFWLLATGAFSWYVRNLAHYNFLYGSIGASIALVVWMYVMSAIALIGCEFNAEIERLGKI